MKQPISSSQEQWLLFKGTNKMYRRHSIQSRVDLRLGPQMSRLKKIDERCNLFYHCIEYLS